MGADDRALKPQHKDTFGKMAYFRTIPVEFNHCDPAGIVFYPRYFEMVNSVVENFFADVVAMPFAAMHAKGGSGVPAVRIDAEFVSPSRLGEKLRFSLDVKAVGKSSLTLGIAAKHDGENRMRAELVIVWIESGEAKAWPDHIRARIESFNTKGM
jgi:4-hydroxybenzoyl-CoA thioesterase